MQKGGETAHQVIGLKTNPLDQVNRVAEWGMKERAGAERRRNGHKLIGAKVSLSCAHTHTF